jgi:hypothetical protein
MLNSHGIHIVSILCPHTCAYMWNKFILRGLGIGGANSMGLVPGEFVHNQIDNHSHADTYAGQGAQQG